MQDHAYSNHFDRQSDTRANEQEFIVSLADVSRFLTRYWTTIAAGLVVGLGLAFFYLVISVPIYTARAQLLIDVGLLQQTPRQAGESTIALDTPQVESHLAVLRSERILMAVIRKFDLTSDPEFVGRAAATGDRGRHDQQQFARDRQVIRTLQAGLEVRRIGLSYAIEVAFSSPNPEKAALILNEIANAFVNDQISARSAATKQGSDWLESRIDSLRADMNRAALAVQAFKARRDYRIQDRGGAQTGKGGSDDPRDGSQITLEELEATASTYRKIFESYLQAYAETLQRQSYSVSSARVITPATRPLSPSYPRRLLVLGAGTLLGALGGLAFALGRLSREQVVSSAEDITDRVGLRHLCALPAAVDSGVAQPRGKWPARLVALFDQVQQRRLAERGLFNAIAEAPFSLFAERIKALRSAVDSAEAGERPLTVGVTAVQHGDDKSTVCLNLAQVYATSGSRTLLIDADISYPAISVELADGTQIGLHEALSGTNSPEACIVAPSYRWPVQDKPSLLPIGTRGSAEAIMARIEEGGMRALLDRLAGSFDVVIIDMGTMEAGSAAGQLGLQLDGVVVVAARGETPILRLREAYRELRSIGVNVIGAVLTRVPAGRTVPPVG